MLLFEQSLTFNRRIIGIGMLGITGVQFIVLFILQLCIKNPMIISDYINPFLILFLIFGIIYSGYSFPALRSKERSISYLMLPASPLEKFLFELLSRIFFFVLLMPILFYIAANSESALIHYWFHGTENSKFSFSGAWDVLTKQGTVLISLIFFFIQVGLFVIILFFTGASHFSKSPLIKTLFFLVIVIFGYSLLSYLFIQMLKLLDYRQLRLVGDGMMPYFKTGPNISIFYNIVLIVVNLSLLAMSFFKLKEREV